MKNGILSLLLVAFAVGAKGQNSMCPDISPQRWGVVSCSAGYMEGSVCSLSCEEHYDLAGTTEKMIETTCGEDGMWSTSTEFLCVPIRCQPQLSRPTNGDLVCSASNLAESLCVFFCDDHHDMMEVDDDRTSYAVCKDDGDGDEFGEWSQVQDNVAFPPSFPPVCEPVKCTPMLPQPENGQKRCSDENKSGSTCAFSCDRGYTFEGLNTQVVFTACQDDDNFDNVGVWTVSDVPECKKYSPMPSCGLPPQIGGITFTCDGDVYGPGTSCEAKCNSAIQEVDGDSSIVCNDEMRWQAQAMPRCVQCDSFRDVEIVAIIHESEDNSKQYSIAARMISKIVTVLQRKHQIRPSVTVNRYSVDINKATEFSTDDFTASRDRARIEAIPFPGNFEDTAKALKYIEERLTGENKVQVAMILTNRMSDYGDEAAKVAERLRARGVLIQVFAIPQRNRMKTWFRETFNSLTGDSDLVHYIGSLKRTEELKVGAARQIFQATLRKGCEVQGKA